MGNKEITAAKDSFHAGNAYSIYPTSYNASLSNKTG